MTFQRLSIFIKMLAKFGHHNQNEPTSTIDSITYLRVKSIRVEVICFLAIIHFFQA